MIIILIFGALLIIGIALLFICDYSWRKISWKIRNVLQNIGIIFTIIGFVVSLIAVAFIIGNNISYDLNYQNTLHEKEMLEYRIEHMEENLTGNEMLYNDIVEFNNRLRSTKKWANNPWTSWFNNKQIASLDYIELSYD